MKAEIKDPEGIINAGLRAAGLEITKDATEMVLNIVDFIRASDEPTLRGIIQLKEKLKELLEAPFLEEDKN